MFFRFFSDLTSDKVASTVPFYYLKPNCDWWIFLECVLHAISYHSRKHFTRDEKNKYCFIVFRLEFVAFVVSWRDHYFYASDWIFPCFDDSLLILSNVWFMASHPFLSTDAVNPSFRGTLRYFSFKTFLVTSKVNISSLVFASAVCGISCTVESLRELDI